MNANDIKRLEELRDRWSRLAGNIDCLYGYNEPAALALVLCVSELYQVMYPKPEATPK